MCCHITPDCAGCSVLLLAARSSLLIKLLLVARSRDTFVSHGAGVYIARWRHFGGTKAAFEARMLGADQIAWFCSWCGKSTKNTLWYRVYRVSKKKLSFIKFSNQRSCSQLGRNMCDIRGKSAYAQFDKTQFFFEAPWISKDVVMCSMPALRTDQTRTLKAEEIAPFILHFAYFIQCPPYYQLGFAGNFYFALCIFHIVPSGAPYYQLCGKFCR